jgi:hypothetical protein
MTSRHLDRIASPRSSDCVELEEQPDFELDDGERTSEEIDLVVAQIKRLTRTASLEFALRVGAVIVHHFYDGNTDAWRARGPRTSSFRQLSRHPDLPLSAGSLCRCVAMFELCERLNAPSRWEHLGVSHLRVVLGLPPAAQERILAEANAKRWTVKTLQQEVLREKPGRLTSGGRRAEAPIAKSLRNVRRSLELHRGVIEQATTVSSRDVEQTRLLLEETRRCLDRLSTCLDRPEQRG